MENNRLILAEFKNNTLNICDYLNELEENSLYEYIQTYKQKINKDNYFLVSEDDVNDFNSRKINLTELNKKIKINHDEYDLDFKNLESFNTNFIDSPENFQKVFNGETVTKNNNLESFNTNFIDSPENFQKVFNGETVTKNNNNSNFTPKEFMNSFNNSVDDKLKELNAHKNLLSKNKKINKKTLLACGGILALGVLVPVVSSIVTPIAIVIGSISILNTAFGKTKEVKNTLSQINLLKKATKNINGEYKPETTFDKKIEIEFLKLCKKQNLTINKKIFPSAKSVYKNNI